MNLDTIDEQARVVLIARNPRSGSGNRGKLVQSLVQALQGNGLEVHVIEDIEELVSSAISCLEAGKLRTVVSAGGDGTVSLLVNRLPPEVPFFVFPLGTANLLAKYLGISTNVRSAVEFIVAGRTTRLDVGQANEKLFLVVASIGFDAEVVHRLHAARKGHINYLTYMSPLLKSIFHYKFPQMNFVADGESLEPARWAFVFNVPKYAIGLEFVRGGDPQDQKLDICTFSGGGFLTGLGYFFSVLFRNHASSSATQIQRFEQLEITSIEGEPIPVELDGDPAGYLPLTLSVIPNRLRVVVPS